MKMAATPKRTFENLKNMSLKYKNSKEQKDERVLNNILYHLNYYCSREVRGNEGTNVLVVCLYYTLEEVNDSVIEKLISHNFQVQKNFSKTAKNLEGILIYGWNEEFNNYMTMRKDSPSKVINNPDFSIATIYKKKINLRTGEEEDRYIYECLDLFFK